MIYLLIFVLLFLYSIKYEINSKIRTKESIFIVLIGFVLSFNYQMGTDWLQYQKIYDIIIKNYELKDILLNKIILMEKAYIMLNVLGNILGLNYEFFMGFLLLFCITSILVVGKNRSRNKYIFIFIIFTNYLLTYSLEPVIRQMIAISILSLGYKYIERRKILNYFIIVVLASLFHKSAILGVFLYYLTKIKLTFKKVLILILMYPIILDLLLISMNTISKFTTYLDKYILYFYSIYYGSSKGNISHYFLNLFITGMWLYIIFYIGRNYKKNYIKNMAIIYILIGYFQTKLLILYRIQIYFVLGFAIYISHISDIKNRNKRIIFIILLYMFMLINTLNSLYNNDLNRIRYWSYKNYFIELLLGNVYQTFEEKKNNYEFLINSLINKQREEIRKKLNNK